MPRAKPVYVDIYDEPLTEDVEEILARFQLTDSVRYEVFSSIWREMCFSDVFIGIIGMSEMKRFCRITLGTAVKYFLPPYSYQIRVGGLYLMFALYHTQPAIPPVKIRFALKDWPQIQKFVKDSEDSGHLDVVYIYQKLVATGAIHYTAMPHFLSYQKQRKPKKKTVCAEFIGRTTAVLDLYSADVLEELTNIQSHYENLKEATVEVSRQVNMTHQDFTPRLKDCMSEFLMWQQKTFSDDKDQKSGDDEDEENKAAEAESCSSRARLLSSIKQKSYGNFQEQSKSRRHRQPEAVDSSSSGAEHVRESASVRRRRPPSLRARTWKSLGVTREECQLQPWLLSAPEHDRVPVKRILQTPPYKP
ncbi:snRNA-activating protein complex subunit 1-like [Centropristis striata]|uniref:snRNA-activating protein complex subunit 1-like n=1 Tax=Centropristis striata TaxID=184440 RepID=UPI0027DF1956|nr:snRNA-activating protein complex subunit 1-like [Centropristis striata]